MWTAALLGVGADESFVRAQLSCLELPGWALRTESVTRRGLVATHVVVDAEDHEHHRPWSRIEALLAGAGLDPQVAEFARAAFRALGTAEARVHGIELDAVHFHEVGAVDAIVDIVGGVAALVSLGVERVVSAPVGLGGGTAAMAHGTVPVPAPAVLELLVGAPTVPVDTALETATPTGVALLVSLVDDWGPPPAGTVLATGRGAGARDPQSHPNVLTAVLVETAVVETAVVETALVGGAQHDQRQDPGIGTAAGVVEATLLETNLDDVTPEVLAHAVQAAIDAGADDAWLTPIVMKKGRPAHLLSVLCRPDRADELRDLIAALTGTLGIRERRLAKHELERSTTSVQVAGHTISIKVGPHGAKPEHDDVAAAASATGRTVREVSAAALTAHAAAHSAVHAAALDPLEQSTEDHSW
jgi:uncharacterized protein (TIGR00299 family) protein